MKTLNSEQRSAVDCTSNNILCIAGAGSGKTTTLVERIAELHERGNDIKKFLVITFTNAAAAELEKRLDHAILSHETKLGYVGTLHGFLLRLLTKHHAMVGLPSTLSVFDDDQKEGFVRSIMAELKVKASLKAVMPLLQRAALVDGARSALRAREELAAIEYHHRLRRAGLLDFDSILHYGEKLVRMFAADHEKAKFDTKAAWTWPYDHLFVDEYQDSSDADARIYDAMPCRDKFFVGDPDQAIYAFRGGNVRHITDKAALHMHHEEGAVVLLQTNYRCRAAIADAAQRLIELNADRFPKRTIPAQAGGAVVVEQFGTPAAELAFVTQELMRSQHSSDTVTAPLSVLCETAVLARTNRIADAFTEHLKGLGIPVAARKHGANPADWRQAKLWLTILANPWNDMAVLRYVEERDGKEQADHVRLHAAKAMKSAFGFAFPGREAASQLDLSPLSAESRERVHDASRQLSDRGEWTINDLIAFLNAGEEHRQEIGQGVTVCTFHAAKGREWDSVFMVGCEDGIVPSERKGTDVQEERRLFYVAMTRARQRLVISYCNARPAPFGPQVMRPSLPSRFIAEACEQPVCIR